MFRSFGSRRRWIVAVIVAAVAILAIALAMGTGTSSRTGRKAQPRHTTAAAAGRPSSAGSISVGSLPTTVSAVPRLPRTNDPALYARQVAAALFDVNTSTVTRAEFLRFWRDELPDVVYADAATKGLTLAAQNQDAIDNLTSWWIPPAAAWSSEAADHTTSAITITSVTVPDYWANAVAGGTFRDPGLRMERLMGVLTQHYGTNPAQQQSSTRAIVIDLGLLCGPTQPGGCRLVAPQQPPGVGDN